MALSRNQEINRLRWRCRRGMRELDALLMGFVDADYASASPVEQAAFHELLSMPDHDILRLLTGQGAGDDPAIDRIVSRLRAQRVS